MSIFYNTCVYLSGDLKDYIYFFMSVCVVIDSRQSITSLRAMKEAQLQ